MHTGNSASPFLPKKRLNFYKLMLMHIKKKQESLSPEDKDLFVKNNTAAQNKHCKSLAPNQKADVYKKNVAEHKKHRKSLSPEQKAQIKSTDAVAHKRYELLPLDKKQDSWKPQLNNVMNI